MHKPYTENKFYICIDLKSFFASVECIQRDLDPMKARLVVADTARGPKGICLAITPAMKKLGIRNRCRVFEIPPHITYITAKPRMKLYMETSAKIYACYLQYISPEDIHVYSIDECFIDVTPYLKLYKKNPFEMALMLMNAVLHAVKIPSTAGIGTNLFLAKVALDITAKHSPDNIGFLNQKIFFDKIWHHKPITDIWNIGHGIASRLEKYNVYDLHGITTMNKKLLYKEFGINAEFLIDHANGIEPCTIADIHAYKPQNNCISTGQLLSTPYTKNDALILVKEMLEVLVLELTEKHLYTKNISIHVGYAKNFDGYVPGSTGGSKSLESYTCAYSELIDPFLLLFDNTTRSDTPIKRLSLSLNKLVPENKVVFETSLFPSEQANHKELQVQNAILNIKHKFGKNALLSGISLLDKATARERNLLIGGHNGE